MEAGSDSRAGRSGGPDRRDPARDVSHPKQSIVPIPLSGFMRPIVVVTPNVLNVGELTLAAKQSQAFTVKSYSTAPVRVTKVEHDLQGFPAASLEERSPAGSTGSSSTSTRR